MSDYEETPKFNPDSLSQVREILLGPVTQGLDQRLRELEQRFDEMAKAQEELQQRLENMSGQWDNQILDEARRLRGEMVDRASLAATFSDFAMRLSYSPSAPEMDPSQPDPELDALLGNITDGNPARD